MIPYRHSDTDLAGDGMPGRALEIATRLTPARLRAGARASGCARAAARMTAIANALEMPKRKEGYGSMGCRRLSSIPAAN